MKNDVLDQSSFCTSVNPIPGTRIITHISVYTFFLAYILHNALWYTVILIIVFRDMKTKLRYQKLFWKPILHIPTYHNMYHLWLNHWVLYFMSTYNMICHFSEFKFPRIVIIVINVSRFHDVGLDKYLL